ncbi:MAG: hypothetical protein KDH96_07230, partial [Candidatus Riesia sp.]|nr:hypothetical protein [Candidatus Riesia sp.]
TQFNSFYSLLSIATNKFLSNFLKLWRDKFNEILDDVIEEFIKDFTDMVEEFYELLLDLTEALFDDIISELNSFILSATNNYSTFLTNIVSLTRTAITNIINEFKRLTTELVPIINQAIIDAEAAMRKIVTKFKDIGKDAVDGFIEQIDLLFERTDESLVIFIKDISDKYAGTSGELYKKGYQIGQDLITGWINGMNSKLPDLLVYVGDIVDSFLAKVTQGLGIQSPSKVMYRLAQYTMDGFIFGIRNKFSELTNTMGMVTSIVSNGISPNIRLTGSRSQQLLLNYADSPLPMYNKGYQKLVSSNTINNGSSYNISNNYTMTVNTKPDKTMNLRRQFRTMEFIGV